TFTVKVTATDKDGATSTAAATCQVVVSQPPPPPPPAILQSDPLNPGKQMLVVNGGTGADAITLSAGANGSVTVVVNGAAAGTFAPTGRIVINGGDGADLVTVPNTIARNVEIYGGAGNDTLL